MDTSEYKEQNKLVEILLQVESAKLNEVIPDLHGHFLLQYSAFNQKIIPKTGLKHHFWVGDKGCAEADVNYEQLPFRESAIDCVLAHHILDYAHSPHQCLREAARIVVPNGYILIVGFNPWSSWGMSRLFTKGLAPSGGHQISRRRVADWLALLGFRLEQITATQFLPPFMLRYFPRLSHEVDRFLNCIGVPWGGVYVIIARKLVAGRTPIRQQWASLLGQTAPLSAPSARSHDSILEKR